MNKKEMGYTQSLNKKEREEEREREHKVIDNIQS